MDGTKNEIIQLNFYIKNMVYASRPTVGIVYSLYQWRKNVVAAYCKVGIKCYRLATQKSGLVIHPQVLYMARKSTTSRVHFRQQNEERGELIHGAPTLK